MMSLPFLRIVALVCCFCLAILHGSLPAGGQILLNPAVSVVTGYDNPLGLCSDSAGNFYVSDSGHFRVIKYSNAGVPLATFTTSNPALNFAYGCVIDSSNNIYIADAGNARVVKLSSVGALQQVFTFTTQPMMYGAHGVALDAQSNLYVTDSYNNRVIIFNSTGGVVAMYSPTSPALNSPEGIAVSSTGAIYVSSQYSNQVVALSASNGSVLATISGPSATPLVNPFGLCLDSNQLLWVADEDNARVVQMNPATGTILQSFTNGGQLVQPVGVSVSPLGTVYVLDFDDDEQPYVVLLSNRTGQQLASYVPPVSLSAPQGVAINAQGSMFVADTSNNRVVQISPQGSTVAVWNLSTTTLPLNQPRSIALDSVGNMYVADAGNNRVVKLQAGTGQLLTTYSTINPALSAPSAVTVDADGNVYIVDTGNSRVVKFNSSGISIAPVFVTINSTADVSFNNPQGICVDQYSNVYVADGDSYSVTNNRVVMFNAAGIQLAAYTAQLHTPGGCAVDLQGNIYISDTYNYLVKIINPTTGRYQVWRSRPAMAPCWPPSLARLPRLWSTRSALCLDSNQLLWVADEDNARVVQMNPATGTILQSFTNGGQLVQPVGVSVSPLGTVYVLDFDDDEQPYVVLLSNRTGQQLASYVPPVSLSAPQGVAINAQGSMFVADTSNNRVVQISPQGSTVAVWNLSTTTLPLNQPRSIALDSVGNMYVADAGNNRVVKLQAGTGQLLTTYSTINPALSAPSAVTVDADGNVYIVDTGNSRVVKFNSSGISIAPVFVTINSTADVSFNNPQGICVDQYSNVYVADGDSYSVTNNRVVMFNAAGIQLAAYTAQLHTPGGCAVDLQGNIYISDTYNYLVKIINPTTGRYQVLMNTALQAPWGIQVAPSGAVYVASQDFDAIIIFLNASAASAVGSLCLLTYSLPGNIDYPWSTATQAQVTYNPYPVINAVGTAVSIQRAVGLGLTQIALVFLFPLLCLSQPLGHCPPPIYCTSAPRPQWIIRESLGSSPPPFNFLVTAPTSMSPSSMCTTHRELSLKATRREWMVWVKLSFPTFPAF